MFVTETMLAAMVSRYGRPAHREFTVATTEKEIQRIRASQKFGRNHDVTLYVRKDNDWLVIAKHFYPPGLYRSMSGGLAPGEDFEAGVAREAREELGCRIRLRRFLLTTEVHFESPTDALDWRSFVFLADYVDGDLNFTDTREIREVRQVPWSAFAEFTRIMRAGDMGGLHYRAALHEAVAELLATAD
ncbi:MAG: NUDIX hydrolase [Candidatus Zixiibacteriota bacterium]|nr:MAG: NUDIX hydrolase [candidate division Zixibacteria bacterium]